MLSGVVQLIIRPAYVYGTTILFIVNQRFLSN